MSELLVQLERNLWSRKEQLTLEEQTFFHKYKIKAFCQFMNGSIAGFVLGLTATKKLNNILLKSALTSVVATTFGVRRFDESLDSTVDHILTLDGSRLQIELSRVYVNSGIDMTAVEESHHCSTSSTPSRAQSRVRKRANRRRRLQNHEGCLGSNDEEARPQGHGVDGQRLANRPTGRGFEA